jgi:hypothetical protein
MPGYSATPLPKKLGIKPGFRVQLVRAPEDVQAELSAELASCFKQKDSLDFAMIFTKSAAQLANEFPRIARTLTPAGMLWVVGRKRLPAWPRLWMTKLCAKSAWTPD